VKIVYVRSRDFFFFILRDLMDKDAQSLNGSLGPTGLTGPAIVFCLHLSDVSQSFIKFCK
jgi:hypothetical protein